MGCTDASSLNYLHTQLIILRSMSPFYPVLIYQLRTTRTLIATIKDFGAHPCPWCFVSVDQIFALGCEDDWKWCEESCCQDSDECRKKVDNARKSLYEEGYSITGDHVDGLLKDESLVPTRVGHICPHIFHFLLWFLLECILISPVPFWLWLSQNVYCWRSAWGQAWGMEGVTNTSHPNASCMWGG